MRRPLPDDDQVSAVMARVLAQAADNGSKATVTAVERALGIPHATFDRNYRHLIDDFRQGAGDQSAAAKRARADSSGKDPDSLSVIWRLRRENEDLRRLVKIYAESIRQLTLDHLELQARLNAAASITTLPTHLHRSGEHRHSRLTQQPLSRTCRHGWRALASAQRTDHNSASPALRQMGAARRVVWEVRDITCPLLRGQVIGRGGADPDGDLIDVGCGSSGVSSTSSPLTSSNSKPG